MLEHNDASKAQYKELPNIFLNFILRGKSSLQASLRAQSQRKGKESTIDK